MNLITQILNDLRVELADEFDRNFERKAFFGKAWPERRRRGKGTLMNVTGTLRRSIRARVSGTSLVFSSSEPHAAIHNDGGIQYVRPHTRKSKKGKRYQVKGYSYKMPRRRFVGNSNEVDDIIKKVISDNMNEELKKIVKKLKS